MTSMYQSIKRKRAEEGTNSGFTLIELLIVIVVLGILAAIVVFSLGTITGKSAVAACQADAQQLNTGLAAYYAGSSPSAYPQQSATGAVVSGWVTGDSPVGLQPNYLQTLPNNSAHYVFSYTITSGVYSLGVSHTAGGALSVIATNASSGTAPLGAAQACIAANTASPF